jgi:hypothetical protein
VDIVMGTFSKSLGSMGGFIAGGGEMIEYLKHRARCFIFTASLPPAVAGGVLKALESCSRKSGRIEQLWRNTRKMHEGSNAVFRVLVARSISPTYRKKSAAPQVGFSHMCVRTEEVLRRFLVPGFAMEQGQRSVVEQVAGIRFALGVLRYERHVRCSTQSATSSWPTASSRAARTLTASIGRNADAQACMPSATRARPSVVAAGGAGTAMPSARSSVSKSRASEPGDDTALFAVRGLES